MRALMGLVLAGGLVLGTAAESKAQFSISIGNPYYGQGLAIGAPGYASGYNSGYSSFVQPGFSGYNTGYSSFLQPGYSSGYNAFSNSAYVAGPGAFSYSSGYRGFAPPAYVYPYRAPVNPYGYANRPYYGNYGYGARNGFRPFRGVYSWVR